MTEVATTANFRHGTRDAFAARMLHCRRLESLKAPGMIRSPRFWTPELALQSLISQVQASDTYTLTSMSLVQLARLRGSTQALQ